MRSFPLRLLLLAALASACGPRSSVDEQVGVIEELDTSETGIIAFVREGNYRAWVAEPAVHDTHRAHGAKVRVFFNDKAVASLGARNAVHPVGTILVKELYDSDGVTLHGHALDVKVSEGPGKDSWLFFESGGPEYRNNYYGRGHATCHGCHEDGQDYVLTARP